MKTLFKTVLATLVALFLSIPLSGCFEEGTKTASQGSDVGSSIFQSKKEGVPDSRGIAVFRLPKGVVEIGATYESLVEANKFSQQFKEKIAAAGIKVKSLDQLGSDVVVTIEVLKEDTTVELDVTGIVRLTPYKRSGLAFRWVAIEGFV